MTVTIDPEQIKVMFPVDRAVEIIRLKLRVTELERMLDEVIDELVDLKRRQEQGNEVTTE